MKQLLILIALLFLFPLAAHAQIGNSECESSFPLTQNPLVSGPNCTGPSGTTSWINGAATGLDWSNIQSTPGKVFGTTEQSGCPGTPTNCKDSEAVLSGSWNSNQMVQATVFSTATGGAKELELHVRTTITAHSMTGYEINCSVDSTNPYMQVIRLNGPLGNWTSIDGRTATVCVTGDVIAAVASGSTISVYKNDVLIFSVTDSTYLNGSPGVGFFNNTDATQNNFGFSQVVAADASGKMVYSSSGSVSQGMCQPAVSSALTAANTAGSTVVIPPGTCAWTTGISYTLPGSYMILGSGSLSASSGFGGGDITVIDDNTGGNNPALAITTGTAASFFRIAGLSFVIGSTAGIKYGGSLGVSGNSQNVRIDHIHTNAINNQPSSGVGITGWNYGVADHNIFDGATNSTQNAFRIYMDPYGGYTHGFGAWADDTNWGTNKFFYVETNIFNGGWVNDCSSGGKEVFRFNTLNNTGGLQVHPTQGASGGRGCRASEIYQNAFNGTGTAGQMFTITSGTLMLWGNTSTTDAKKVLNIDNLRRSNKTYNENGTPNDWGYCGTSFNGTGSAWDQNSNASTGYHCLDNPGMGKSDLLSGNFPNIVNTTTGTIAWPHQQLEPIYEFANVWTVYAPDPKPSISNNDVTAFSENVDYYVYTPSFNGSLTCSTAPDCGTGSGTLAARPSTCTTGVAYWATDQGSWNTSGNGTGSGVLYVCTSTNTWTVYYTPYTYPHPLVTGAQLNALSPSCSPSSGAVPQTVTCTNPNSGTTVMCYAVNPTNPATDGTGVNCSTGTKYTTSLSISSAETLNVIAGVAGQLDSSIVSYTYTSGAVAPTVTTTTATSITFTSALSGGTVTTNGGASVTSEGVCYGTSSNPTTPCTSDGTATPFTSSLTGLNPGTTYYYRAFATNSAGTAYGSNLSFSTLTNCPNPTSVGIYTFCNEGYWDIASTTTNTVNLAPYPGNGVEIFVQYCGDVNCTTAPTQTATISDNINNPETCFTVSPHSPYNMANPAVPDYERFYAWYCPSIPSGVTSFTVTTNVTSYYLQLDVIEWESGTIASTSFFDPVDRLISSNPSGNAAPGSTATISTSGSTTSANELITASIQTCSGSVPGIVGTGYTGIIVNPPYFQGYTNGHVTEAIQASSASVQTATTTWTYTGSIYDNCALGYAAPNDTWFGVIVPLKSASPIATFTPSSLAFGSQLVYMASAPQSVTLQNTGGVTLNATNFGPTNVKYYVTNNTCGTPATIMFGGTTASFSLAPSASCTFSVVFLPNGVGSVYAGGIIESDNTAGGTSTLILSGIGFPAPAATSSFQ